MNEMKLTLVIDHNKRKILADLIGDNNVFELDDDTFDYIWNQYDLENNESIQELLREQKEYILKEMSING